MRETPSGWDGMARDIDLSRVGRQEEYFLRRVWTDSWVICPSGNFVSRTRHSARSAVHRGAWTKNRENNPMQSKADPAA
jgi:hypothetical protein